MKYPLILWAFYGQLETIIKVFDARIPQIEKKKEEEHADEC